MNKPLKNLLLTVAVFLLCLFACDREETESIPIVVPAKEFVNGFLAYEYLYDGRQLKKMRFRIEIYNPPTGQTIIDTVDVDFDYDATGKLIHIQEGPKSIFVEYEEQDLIFNTSQGVSVPSTVRFVNYQALEIPQIELTSGLEKFDMLVQYDDRHNVRSATDQNGGTIENTYPFLIGKMYSYFSIMDYDDMHQPFENLHAAVQLYRNWHKNQNNLLRRYFQNEDWLYTNEYDQMGFLTKQSRVVADKAGNIKSNPLVTTFQYLVIP